MRIGPLALFFAALAAFAPAPRAAAKDREAAGQPAPPAAAPEPALRPPDPRLFRILGVTLGRSGFDPVMKVLGKAPITPGRSGARVICYVGPDDTRVVFEETATGWGYIIYSMVTPPKELVTSNGRAALFRLNQATPNGVGLHTGQHREELIDLLGPPALGESARLTWLYQAEEAVAPGSDPRLPPDMAKVTVRTKLSVRIKHNKATRISVSCHEKLAAPEAAGPL